MDFDAAIETLRAFVIALITRPVAWASTTKDPFFYPPNCPVRPDKVKFAPFCFAILAI